MLLASTLLHHACQCSVSHSLLCFSDASHVMITVNASVCQQVLQPRTALVLPRGNVVYAISLQWAPSVMYTLLCCY
jgi:hypothetical protein